LAHMGKVSNVGALWTSLAVFIYVYEAIDMIQRVRYSKQVVA
jgi:hypothetical protein